ncbi:hypothetical protein [Xanthovirga aplysinae]|uniref:hypothetical protein n=1 Tax=Xanthovirga aplysinae TaxID=2529853 RepID=UPI0012BC83E6|nr:hypothetical protein [Xanthovirga aplysinae]MTI32615.1 hypothetical protein [Xanthovirga aplysinae]
MQKSDPLKTLLTITIGFLLIFIFLNWEWALWVSLLMGLVGVFSNYLTVKVDYLWMKLAYLLSLVVPKVILSVIFYIFLFPISLFSKWFGKKDPLMLRDSQESTYIEGDKAFDKESFENPW